MNTRLCHSAVQRRADKLACGLHRPVLFLFKGLQAYRGYWNTGCTTIGPEDELRVYDEINRISTAHGELCLCLNAFGGSSTSAFNICRLLRSRFRRITAYVPHAAASAATLLALCADRILVAECGYMSMVDPMLRVGPQLVEASHLLDKRAGETMGWMPEQLMAARSSIELVEEQLTSILSSAGYDESALCSVKDNLLLCRGFHDMPISRDQLRAFGVSIAPNRSCDTDEGLRMTERILRLSVRGSLKGFVYAGTPDGPSLAVRGNS
jgi:hypothetical protein